jgi:hypothetical protein
MAWTWDEILTDALSLSGILGEDQQVDPSMLASAKIRASKLLDELDGKGIALPVFSTAVEFDTVGSQTRYVLGTGADASPASALRPELILDAEIQIQPGDQPVWIPLRKLAFQDYREYISVPRNQSQPINYAWNPGWPQGELYLWPSPNQIWKIRLTTTLKWIDVVGNPSDDWYANAALPSGYTNAFTDILAYRLAQLRRLSTDDLKSKAKAGEYVMSTYTMNHVPRVNTKPSSFPWDVNRAGLNP